MKVTKKQNLVVVMREYVDANNNNKKVWRTIGELVTFEDDNGEVFQKVELYHMPKAQISVFAQKERDAQPSADSATDVQIDGEIGPDGIPF